MLTEVQGQEQAVFFLRRMVEGSFTSPMILEGDDGTGRRFAALQTVKETLCTGSHSAACKCFDCSQIDLGTHPDVMVVIPPEGKDIGVEAMRDVVEQAGIYPSTAAFRFFVIDGVDRMTPAAGNAVLKTLEESPPTTRFLLIAEAYRSVIPTIRSRCGRLSFRKLPEAVVLSVLQQHESDPGKALVYARIADGSIGRALRYWGSGRLHLRDQVLTLLELGLAGDLSSLFARVDTIGTDLSLALRFLEQALHDLLMIQYDPNRMINVDATERFAQVRGKLSPIAHARLMSGVRLVRTRYNAAKINLAFHVKTLFAEAFFSA